MKQYMAIILTTTTLLSCASTPDTVKPTHYQPLNKTYSCEEIYRKRQELQNELNAKTQTYNIQSLTIIMLSTTAVIGSFLPRDAALTLIGLSLVGNTITIINSAQILQEIADIKGQLKIYNEANTDC